MSKNLFTLKAPMLGQIRHLKAKAASGLVVLLLSAAAAAAYPDRPVKVILPAAPGGSADTVLRLICNELTARLGQPFVIENKPGASGGIGLAAIAQAPADGYTLGVTNLAVVVGSLSAKSRSYDVLKDFTPIAKTHSQTNVLAVNKDLPVKSVSELVAYAKANPKKVFFGSSGNGTTLHVIGELFRSSSRIEIEHVPYRSAPYAEADLVSGQIQMMFSNLTSLHPHISAGRARALAVTSPKRSALMPSIPTIAEAGVPAAEMVTWGGFVGPSGLPQEIVQKLNASIGAVLSQPKVKKRLSELGYEEESNFMSAEEFGGFIKKDVVKWGAVIKDNKITSDQ